MPNSPLSDSTTSSPHLGVQLTSDAAQRVVLVLEGELDLFAEAELMPFVHLWLRLSPEGAVPGSASVPVPAHGPTTAVGVAAAAPANVTEAAPAAPAGPTAPAVRGLQRAVLDLSAVTFVDVSGLRVLHRLHQHARDAGVGVTVVGVGIKTRWVMDLAAYATWPFSSRPS